MLVLIKILIALPFVVDVITVEDTLVQHLVLKLDNALSLTILFVELLSIVSKALGDPGLPVLQHVEEEPNLEQEQLQLLQEIVEQNVEQLQQLSLVTLNLALHLVRPPVGQNGDLAH